MSATVTRTRTRAIPSLDTNPKHRHASRCEPIDCTAAWSEVVFSAIFTLKSLLSSQNEATALEASRLILELEKTRIRHKLPIAGTGMPSDCLARSAPATDPPCNPTPLDVVDPDALIAMSEEDRFEYYVEIARREMQAGEDARGSGVVVSRAVAENVVRGAVAESLQLYANPPPVSGSSAAKRVV